MVNSTIFTKKKQVVGLATLTSLDTAIRRPGFGRRSLWKSWAVDFGVDFAQFLSDLTWFCLSDFTWFCTILKDFTWFWIILSDFTWFCIILKDFNLFCMIWSGFLTTSCVFRWLFSFSTKQCTYKLGKQVWICVYIYIYTIIYIIGSLNLSRAVMMCSTVGGLNRIASWHEPRIVQMTKHWHINSLNENSIHRNRTAQ